MIKLVNQYKLELSSVPFEPDDGKVYYVSTEIIPSADRFVEDNLEELRQVFAQEGLEFVYVRARIGKDVSGHDVPPTVFSHAISRQTEKGIAFSAYHIELEKDKSGGDAVLSQLLDVAKIYSRKKAFNYHRESKDPETVELLEEMERVARALKMKGVKPSLFDAMLSSLSTPSELVIDIDGNLTMPDFGRLQIKMNPIEKALYLFLIQHPEGIEPDALVGFRKELLRLYRHFTIFSESEIIETSIDNLLSEDKGPLYTHISRINKKIEAKLGGRAARPYQIHFQRKPEPGRYLIDVPSEKICWEQRF